VNRAAAIIASGVVTLAIVAGLIISGPPWHRRDLRLDQQRVNDLQLLSSQVEQYWQRNERLPQSLTDLIDGTHVSGIPSDPATGQAYGYRVEEPRNFALCTNFTLPSEPAPAQDFWNHLSGLTCFSFKAGPP